MLALQSSVWSITPAPGCQSSFCIYSSAGVFLVSWTHASNKLPGRKKLHAAAATASESKRALLSWLLGDSIPTAIIPQYEFSLCGQGSSMLRRCRDVDTLDALSQGNAQAGGWSSGMSMFHLPSDWAGAHAQIAAGPTLQDNVFPAGAVICIRFVCHRLPELMSSTHDAAPPCSTLYPTPQLHWSTTVWLKTSALQVLRKYWVWASSMSWNRRDWTWLSQS